MNEKYFSRWVPMYGVPEELYLEGLYDDYEGFRLILKNTDGTNMYRISFVDHLAYRNSDESDRIKTLRNNLVLSEKWSLFEASESQFIEWIVSESQGIQSKKNLKHIVIVTPNDIIEVICLSHPIFEEL